MPVARFEGGGGDQESLPGGSGGTDFDRVNSNLALSEQIGKFVAGEVQAQFKDENLADKLKGGDRAFMASVSWG